MIDVAQDVTVDRLAADIPGERTAVVSASGVLSYAAFGAAVNHMAEVLRTREIERDACVAVIVPRSPELVVAVHGILRAGAAYVPIDPEYPSLRIRTIIEDSGARVVVAGTEYGELADQLGISRIEPSTAGADPVEPITSPDDLAYVTYTSGSTGQPKGVEVEHRSVVNRLQWMQRRYPLGPDDVILQKTPVTFDVSVWELMWWAMTGASVALLEPGSERDPRKIVAAVERHRVTVMHFVPSMLGPFVNQLEQQPDWIHRLTSLRTVFSSGEALTPALVERFNRVFGAIGAPRLVNLYGPTEATVDVSYFDCPSTGPVDVVPIGKPIDNTTLLILDERGNRCPVGVQGELNIAGVGLARGYRGRPDLTAIAFVADERVPGGRRYRTGDLARWRADGNLEFLGRIDDEVKVRGNRVSLGEVQAAMESCPGLRSAVVIAESSDTHGTSLIGYFVADSVSIDRLGDHLAQRLPAYMIPTTFVELTTLPLAASGKVDRRALPRPSAPDRLAVAPRTPAEAALVDVFASVLKIESVGIHDNFFTIGGDSILALSVRSEAEKRGIALDVEELFARPTIAELAESISQTVPEPEGVTDAFALLPLIDRAALHDAEDAFPVYRITTRNVVPQQRTCRIHNVQGRLPISRGDAVAGRGVYGRVRSFGRAASRATVVIRTEPTFRAGAGCQGTGAACLRRRDRSRRCGRPGLHGGPTQATVRRQSRCDGGAVQLARVCPGRRCGPGLRVPSRTFGRLECCQPNTRVGAGLLVPRRRRCDTDRRRRPVDDPARRVCPSGEKSA